MNAKTTTMPQNLEFRVLGRLAHAEWERANALENQVWALLAACAGALLLYCFM